MLDSKVLVFDLDETLIHSVLIKPEEGELKQKIPN